MSASASCIGSEDRPRPVSPAVRGQCPAAGRGSGHRAPACGRTGGGSGYAGRRDRRRVWNREAFARGLRATCIDLAWISEIAGAKGPGPVGLREEDRWHGPPVGPPCRAKRWTGPTLEASAQSGPNINDLAKISRWHFDQKLIRVQAQGDDLVPPALQSVVIIVEDARTAAPVAAFQRMRPVGRRGRRGTLRVHHAALTGSISGKPQNALSGRFGRDCKRDPGLKSKPAHAEGGCTGRLVFSRLGPGCGLHRQGAWRGRLGVDRLSDPANLAPQTGGAATETRSYCDIRGTGTGAVRTGALRIAGRQAGGNHCECPGRYRAWPAANGEQT